MKLVRRLTLLLSPWILVHGQGLAGQAPAPLSFGVPIERAVRSGEVHEYGLTAGAGDLISGTLTLPGLAALVEIVGNTGQVIRTTYRFEDDSVPTRLGFVAPAAGIYSLRIKAFDRFDGGSQVTPGHPFRSPERRPAATHSGWKRRRFRLACRARSRPFERTIRVRV